MLRRHVLTQALIEALGDQPSTSHEILEDLPRRGRVPAGARRSGRSPGTAAAALARFAALLSDRATRHGDRPFLHVETHLWVRPLSRIVRLISDRPAFGWYGEAAAGGGDYPRRHATRRAARRLLPALRPVRLDRDLAANAIPRTWRSNRRRSTGPPSPTSAWSAPSSPPPGRKPRRARPPSPGAPTVLVLEPDGRRVRPLNPASDLGDDDTGDERQPDGVFVLCDLRHDREGNRNAEQDRCPACEMDEGIRFLGAGLASLASVAITELFTGGELGQMRSEDAAVQRLGAGRGAPRRVRRQPLLLLLPAHAARRDPGASPRPSGVAQRPHRRRDHAREQPATGCPPSCRPTCRAARTWTRCSPGSPPATRTPGG